MNRRTRSIALPTGPVLRDRSIAGGASAAWEALQARIVDCERCPRLREHCIAIAREKRLAFRDWTYWGKPVPNLGLPSARLLIVGLAPAAHGANRTGRLFTGDRSGDFLFQAMFNTGFANQPTSQDINDGLQLIDAAITGVAHCAPPDNKPAPQELASCDEYLRDTLDLMPNLRVVMALGLIAFKVCLRHFRQRQWLGIGRCEFAHGAMYAEPRGESAAAPPALLAAYHPSQQNTFTRRLTPAMLEAMFGKARSLL